MRRLNIYADGRIELKLKTVKEEELPANVQEAIAYFRERGNKTIEVILFDGGGCTFRFNGIMDSMLPERYADPGPKHRAALKSFLSGS